MSDWRSRAKPVQAAPTSDWRSRAQAVQTEDPIIPVVDEAQPDIGFADRFVAKNFANSPESMAKYIAQEYPGLDVKVIDGEVVARRPDSPNYQKLDPSTLEWSDITDMGDVVTSGIASQLGTWGGAAAGALAGAPAAGVGAVPGAVAGGVAGAASASAAHEGLRQYLGQKLGIPQEVSGGDVALAGALGGAGVGVFGSGGLSGLAKAGETQGLIRAGWNKGMPKLASTLTGASDEAISLYTNPATRAEVEGLISGGRTQFTDDLVSKVTAGLNQEKQKVGQALRSSIDGAGDNVNLAGAKKAFRSQIAALKDTYRKMPTPENKAAYEAAENSYLSLFKDIKKSGQEIVIPGTPQSEIDAYAKRLADYETNMANFMSQDQAYRSAAGQAAGDNAQPVLPGLVDDLQRSGNVPQAVELNGQSAAEMLPAPYDPNQQELFQFDNPLMYRRNYAEKVARQQDRKLNEAFKQELFDAGEQADIVGTNIVPRTYAEVPLPRVMDATGQTEMVFAPNQIPQAPEALQIIPDSIVRRDNVIPNDIKPSLAWRLQQQLKDYGDLRKISGGVNPRYASQATADEKALADSALSAYQSIGAELGRVTGNKSPELKSQYAGLMDIQDALSPLNGNTQSAYSAFKNLDGSGKVAFREALENLSERTGKNYTGEANMLQAADYFGTRSWMPQSMKGTTSTSRTLTGGGIGSGVGFLLGGYPGMMVGGAAGAVGSSPQGLRYGIRLTDPLRSGADALGRLYQPATPVIRETLVKTPWMDM